MATHSSTLAWKIPQTEEPGGLWSMGSLRVGHDGVASLSLFTFMHWGRKWQPTPVLLPGESQGWWSLVGCHLRGRTESDTTEVIQQQQEEKAAKEFEKEQPVKQEPGRYSITESKKPEAFRFPVLCSSTLLFLCFMHSSVFLGFPGGAGGKESTCHCRSHKRRRFELWLGRSPGGGHGNPLRYSCLENPMDRGTWWATVHGVTKSWT